MDLMLDEIMHRSKKDEIEMCLNCPLPKCVDCLNPYSFSAIRTKATVLQIEEGRKKAHERIHCDL